MPAIVLFLIHLQRFKTWLQVAINVSCTDAQQRADMEKLYSIAAPLTAYNSRNYGLHSACSSSPISKAGLNEMVSNQNPIGEAPLTFGRKFRGPLISTRNVRVFSVGWLVNYVFCKRKRESKCWPFLNAVLLHLNLKCTQHNGVHP